VPGEPWLGLDIPAGAHPGDDRLLYTAHLAEPHTSGQPVRGLLVDEWTERLGIDTTNTGLAFQFNRPDNEAPQAMLLVAPPRSTGAWRWEDLVAALHETLDLVALRAVEPAHLESLPYAALLPATLSATQARQTGRGHGRQRGHRTCPGRHPGHSQHRDQDHGEAGRGDFGKHPNAEIYLSQPGLGTALGPRVLAEFGDDKQRYADATARKNYAGTSPITRQSGKKKHVLARYVHNDRLIDALGLQAFAAPRLTRRPHLLRPTPCPRRRPSRRAAPARQPARLHTARLRQHRQPIPREHRLGAPAARSTKCGLTTKLMECLRVDGSRGQSKCRYLDGGGCAILLACHSSAAYAGRCHGGRRDWPCPRSRR
jgi:hypothetical protein